MVARGTDDGTNSDVFEHEAEVASVGAASAESVKQAQEDARRQFSDAEARFCTR